MLRKTGVKSVYSIQKYQEALSLNLEDTWGSPTPPREGITNQDVSQLPSHGLGLHHICNLCVALGITIAFAQDWLDGLEGLMHWTSAIGKKLLLEFLLKIIGPYMVVVQWCTKTSL